MLVVLTVLYATAISVTWAPGDVTSYVDFLKNLNLSSAIWFPVKATCAFPLVYHYINGIRHLVRNIYCWHLLLQSYHGLIVKVVVSAWQCRFSSPRSASHKWHQEEGLAKKITPVLSHNTSFNNKLYPSCNCRNLQFYIYRLLIYHCHCVMND